MASTAMSRTVSSQSAGSAISSRLGVRPSFEVSSSDVVLTPASCYPVYPIIARSGPLPEGGWLVDSASWCFRREPSLDPVRMQMFRYDTAQTPRACF